MISQKYKAGPPKGWRTQVWAPSCGSWWGQETWDGGRSPLKCFKFYLLAVSQGMLALSSQTRDGTHPCPLHWPYRALTTGPPGKSWKLTFLYLHFSVLGEVEQECTFILSVLFSEWTDHTPSRTNILIFSHHLHPQDVSRTEELWLPHLQLGKAIKDLAAA